MARVKRRHQQPAGEGVAGSMPVSSAAVAAAMEVEAGALAPQSVSGTQNGSKFVPPGTPAPHFSPRVKRGGFLELSFTVAVNPGTDGMLDALEELQRKEKASAA